MPASSSRALTRSEADLLIAQMQKQLWLLQAARPATPTPEPQLDLRKESEVEAVVVPAPLVVLGSRKRTRAQEETTEMPAMKKSAPAREQTFVAAL